MLHRNGKYSVDVGTDGAIKVKHGDWLSKYSAAMFNTFWRVNEFGRMGRSGLEPIKNVNLIYAGETIYHIPTYNKSRPPRVPPVPTGPTPSDAEKKAIIKNTLAHDYHLHGEQLHLLEEALDIAHIGGTALEIAEIAGLIEEGGAMAGVATAAGLLNIVIIPLISAIEIVNALQTGQKLAGLAAIAYTTTAWAFDDPIPQFPERVKRNLRSFGMANEIAACEKAWQEASNTTLKNLAEAVAKKRVSKRSLQIVLRAVAGDNRQTLCRTLLKDLEKKVHGTPEKMVLREYEYPN